MFLGSGSGFLHNHPAAVCVFAQSFRRYKRVVQALTQDDWPVVIVRLCCRVVPDNQGSIQATTLLYLHINIGAPSRAATPQPTIFHLHQAVASSRTVGMANQDSLGRPTRARNKVLTYNLRILSGTSRSSCRRSHNVDPQSARHSDPRISTGEQDNLETTESLEEHFQQNHGEDSSELTSPMMSPNLLALETSLSKEGTTSSPANNTSLYDCFNATLHPKGHFYSAKKLFARGVWIGYLSPDRHSESFHGLPSFSTLKANFTNFIPPYPPAIGGFVRGERHAVCRGCASSTSGLIAFFEIQFMQTSVSHVHNKPTNL